MELSITFVSLPKNIAMMFTRIVITPMEAIIITLSDAFLFLRGRYTFFSTSRLDNIVMAIARTNAIEMGMLHVCVKKKNA